MSIVGKPKVSATGTVTRYGQWQPIETAPRDGTPVLIYAAEYEGLSAFQCVAGYDECGGWCVDELRGATHWMPLPPRPGTDS